jgi:peptidoglycan/xylan/chitin deacetylase (PgdA/CDA1 family)
MRWLVALLVAVSMSLTYQRVDPLQPNARVALTFDDLPVHGPLPPGLSRVDVVRRIAEALGSHRAPPVYGFINGKAADEDAEGREVLRVWRAAGNPLANHSFSHMDLHAASVAAFEQDVIANEAVLRAFMSDGDWRWFRYPFLREGDTPEKYRAVRAFLKERGYRVAQVTLDFHDYAYNDPYARCLARGDKGALAWLEKQYIEQAAASLVDGQVAERVKAERERRVRDAQADILSARNAALAGETVEVLVERTDGRGRAAARHRGQAPEVDGSVLLSGFHGKAGEIVPARVTGAREWDLRAACLPRRPAAESGRKRLTPGAPRVY